MLGIIDVVTEVRVDIMLEKEVYTTGGNVVVPFCTAWRHTYCFDFGS